MIDNSSIYKLGNLYGKDIYYDKYQKDNEYLIGWEQHPLMDIGTVWIPYVSMIDIKKTAYNQDEIKNKKDKTFSDIKYIIGGSTDLYFYKKLLDNLKQL